MTIEYTTAVAIAQAIMLAIAFGGVALIILAGMWVRRLIKRHSNSRRSKRRAGVR